MARPFVTSSKSRSTSSDTSLFTRYNTVYAQRFSKPYPVRTTVGSDRCHSPGMLIEIDYIAYRAEKMGRRKLEASKKGGAAKKIAGNTR